ncbi:hypothetical protein J8273_0734 [Carpediemonas membranifera]|uniref:Uncharacterized protein n=1 Tax=Carpediemonas membranifera TaxID=201153 RepID=A0A8J6BBY7_9EUKA|nr:hypothetical protein J8273_0734 [Carpediemonas membranifera]|eukprot:KAG9397604.1 hypothetical protein J8273_0734 [Carpediemonas membranifera]
MTIWRFIVLVMALIAVAMCYRSGQVVFDNPNIAIYDDSQYSYFITLCDSTYGLFMYISGIVRDTVTNRIIFSDYVLYRDEIPNNSTIMVSPYVSMEMPDDYDDPPFYPDLTGTYPHGNHCFDRTFAGFDWIRRSENEIWQLVDIKNLLTSFFIEDRPGTWPMYAEDDRLFIFTQREMLVYDVRLFSFNTIRNVSLVAPPLQVLPTFDKVLPYFKNDISIIAVGEDDEGNTWIASFDTDCTEFVGLAKTSSFGDVWSRYSFRSRLTASKFTDDGVTYGFIDFTDFGWAFSTQHTINDPDKRVVSVIVADDTDNDVAAVTYTYGQGTGADQQIVSESFLADSDLNKIDGTESIFSYAVADYPCVATGECWTTRFQVEKGSYMINNKTLTTTDNVTSSKTIVTWQFDDVLESGAVWVRIGILAVVLALAVVA